MTSGLVAPVQQDVVRDEVKRLLEAPIVDTKGLSVFFPLSSVEKDSVVLSAMNILRTAHNITQTDFAYHWMVQCECSPSAILSALIQYPSSSRTTLEQLWNYVRGGECAAFFKGIVGHLAFELSASTDAGERDKGHHLRMMVAEYRMDWSSLKRDLSSNFSDLRQRVLERFLTECPFPTLLSEFIKEFVLAECEDRLCFSHPEETKYTHWVILCMNRLCDILSPREVQVYWEAHPVLHDRFYPWSVKRPMEDLYDRLYPEGRPSCYPTDIVEYRNVYSAPLPPRTVADAISQGWQVIRDDGRQAVLQKDGKSMTLHRPKAVRPKGPYDKKSPRYCNLSF